MSPARDDRRYNTRRWQRVRRLVLQRDLHTCRIVAGCTTRATVADHIRPARLDMTDAEFFDPRNLRAGCRPHNIARGLVGDAPPEASGPTAVVTGDYT